MPPDDGRAVTVPAAVLFDMDGTTVETESLWYAAEIATMRRFDTPWTAHDQERSVGGPFERVVAYMAEKCDVAETAIAYELSEQIHNRMQAHDLVIQPGILSLVTELRRAGIATALVSNSFRALVDLVLESTNLKFDVTIAGDEAAHPKPDPDPYLLACQLLRVEPRDCVVLEDSVIGIASATAAGCAVVAIPAVGLIEPGPRGLVVNSLREVDLSILRRLVES